MRLAAYHLEGEANLWWQWFRKAMSEERRDLFEDEIRSRFGPTDAEDFNEALSERVRTTGDSGYWMDTESPQLEHLWVALKLKLLMESAF